MKKLLMAAMLMYSIATVAQGRKENAGLYWVVESNTMTPDYSVVKFYNEQNNLVHEVKLDTRLNILKRKDRNMLKSLMKKYADRTTAERSRNKSVSSI